MNLLGIERAKKVNSYINEFKADVVKLIDEEDSNISAAAKSLGGNRVGSRVSGIAKWIDERI